VAHWALALWSDLTQSRLWRYWTLNPALILVVLAAVALVWPRLRSCTRSRRWVLAVPLMAHLVVAAPIRAKVLTRYVAPKGFYDRQEHSGYLRLRHQTEQGARVFPLSGEGRFRFLIGLDKSCRPWHQGELEMSHRLAVEPGSLPTHELVSWLRSTGYRYLVIDPRYQDLLRKHGGEAAFSRRIDELDRHPGVEQVFDSSSGEREPPSRFVLYRLRNPPGELQQALSQPISTSLRVSGSPLRQQA